MAKIGVVISSLYACGGEERVVSLMANEWVKQHEVTIFTFEDREREGNRNDYPLSGKIKVETNDFEIMRKYLEQSNVPMIAEGNIDTPEKARHVLELGCFSVVVGSIITRPQLITKRFVDCIEG